jgi:hypothetical protein
MISMLSTAALAAAHDDKQDVVDNIVALASETDGRRASWMLRMAAHLVERGLADGLWEGDATPATAGTFGADALAMAMLNMAGRRSHGISDAVTDLKADLTRIDRNLATDRLAAAVASSGNDRKIARAERLIDRGDAFADADRYGRAVRAYMRAWRVATRGMGDGTATTDTPAPSPAISVAANVSHDGVTWLAADAIGDDRVVAWEDYPVDFQWVITNDGNVDLTNVDLTDSVYDEVATDCAAPTLAPGESYTCTMPGEMVNGGDYVNTATVTATGAGVAVSDSNSVHLDVRGGGGG